MENYTMMQFFGWYYPTDGSLWNRLKDQTNRLKDLGVDAIWLPPAHKGAAGGYSVGYDSYDIYDLGEFEQKGSVRTKYGTKQELIDAVKTARDAGLNVYADIVLNHMSGADETEMVMARKVNPDNRNEFISDAYEIEAFTKFTFPARGGQHSDFVWDHQCFSGVDYDQKTQETAIFSIQNQYGEGWEDVFDDENGNYDYLMAADIDFRNPAVREELKRWGKWLLATVPYNGLRLDAVKHIEPGFYHEWLDYMRNETGKELFTVAEYWSYDVGILQAYIDRMDGKVSLFDAPLHLNLHNASSGGSSYDMRTIFDNTLVAANPLLAVTLVENHDTQPLQSLAMPVEQWFKPISYALILLREAGYPCIFYPDMYGTKYTGKGDDGNDHEVIIEPCEGLEALLYARKNVSYGMQRDYFDHTNCIGWTREGDGDHENSGCAVVISNGNEGSKSMEIGKLHTGKTFVDYLGKHDAEIVVDENGWAEFYCRAGSVSVWAIKN